MTRPAHADSSGGAAGSVRTADILAGFSLASDLAVGHVPEHGARSCYIGMHLARTLGLAEDEQSALFYAELLKDAGCTAYLSQLAALWLVDELAAKRDLQYVRDSSDPLEVLSWAAQWIAAGLPLATRAGHIFDFLRNGPAVMREGFESTCQMASRIAERLGMPLAVQQALLHVFEQWDGKGMPNGRRSSDIPVVSRVVLLTSYIDIFHRIGGRAAATEMARKRRGKAFDPDLVDAFLAAARNDSFWEGLEQERIWDRVLELEPSASPYRHLPASRLSDVAEAMADYTDMKAPYLAGHSRRVASTSERIGRRMGLSEQRVEDVHRAGLVFDIGLVAVPSYVLGKSHASMSEAERERYRLHAHHSHSIVSRIGPFERLVPAVSAHHERFDGRGYPAGLTAPQISLEARILAVADRFDALTHDSPDGAAVPIERASELIRVEGGMALAPDVIEALLGTLDGDNSPVRQRERRAVWPAGLTDREVQVLRLVAQGGNRRQVAATLVVSEGTIRSHLEHIYTKIAVSNRAGATLFAMEHGLLN